MPVSENSKRALTNPETRAKAQATVQRNKEARTALKNKLLFDKLEAQTDSLIPGLKKELLNETSSAFKLTNIDCKVKTIESQVEALKTQVNLNLEEINKLKAAAAVPPFFPPVHAGHPYSVTHSNSSDSEHTKEALKGIKKTVQKLADAHNDIRNEMEEADTTMHYITTQLDHDKKVDKYLQLDKKINLLFNLMYRNTSQAGLTQYCDHYNTEPLPPPEPAQSLINPRRR
jgi:hypothetical protein